MRILVKEGEERYVLLTRPETDSHLVAQEIQEKFGLPTCLAPMLEIEYMQGLQPPDMTSFEAMLFTSAHAVDAVIEQFRWDMSKNKIFAIGDKTAEKLISYGVQNLLQANGTSEDLCRIIAKNLSSQSAPILHLCGRHVSDTLKYWIDHYTLNVQPLAIYKAKEMQDIPENVQSLIIDGKISDVIFYSARTAKIFVKIMKKKGLENLFQETRVLCLSPSVVKSIEEFCWGDIKIAKTPSTCAILDLLNNPNINGENSS